MSTIAVIGATGYAGGHIAAEALDRGHQVIAVNRGGTCEPRPGLTPRAGSVADPAFVDELAQAADAVIVSVHPLREDFALIDALPALLTAAAGHHARLGIVGGAGSLLVSPDGPRLLDLPEFPARIRPAAEAHQAVLTALQNADTTADWFYLCPAEVFGSYAPGERVGTYRVGDDVRVADADGKSFISGPDYAIAVLDEIETPAHHQARFTVAY